MRLLRLQLASISLRPVDRAMVVVGTAIMFVELS